jgi:NADH:ubiquinone oxidoreductase subunit 5 (subunit L)/multisubunit Na+/H+ antiporter MnhA subunit
MVRGELLLLLTVFVPFFGSFLLPLLGKVSESIRNLTALLLVVFSFGAAIGLVPVVSAGEVPTVVWAGAELFAADRLAVLMALVSLSVGSLIVLYSIGYIAHYENRNEYYFMVVLFLASMMGLVFSRNLIGIYLFWEITALACWRLIGFFRKKEYVLRADKAFLITVFGALSMLIGFVMVYDQAGSFNLSVIASQPAPTALALGLIMLGIFSKSATLPLHTWLADAGVAPSTVTALLHAAVLVKIGVYVYARLFCATFALSPEWAGHDVVAWVAAASAIVSACAALVETDIKRIIAFSTVSQLAFIFLGLAMGSPIGVAGALLYIMMHGIAKGGLFLCAGVVEQNTHTKDITKLGGLWNSMPITGWAFIMCALSVMGVPPFGGFFSKYMVITSAVQSGRVWLALVFMAGAFLTVMYLLRVFYMVFLGDARDGHTEKEGSSTMVFTVATLAVMALLSGLLVSGPARFVEATVRQMGVM